MNVDAWLTLGVLAVMFAAAQLITAMYGRDRDR